MYATSTTNQLHCVYGRNVSNSHRFGKSSNVVLWALTYDSEEHTACIFRVEKSENLQSLKVKKPRTIQVWVWRYRRRYKWSPYRELITDCPAPVSRFTGSATKSYLVSETAVPISHQGASAKYMELNKY